MDIDGCKFPDNLLYDVDNDTWAEQEGSLLKVGITSVLGWLSGGFTSFTLKPVGTPLERGKSFGSVEGPRHFGVVRSPVSGVIVGHNPKVFADPKVLNREPFSEGWMVLIRPSGPSGLPTAAQAMQRLIDRVRELKVHCFSNFPDHEMFEIGTECSAVLVKLNELLEASARGTVVHVVSDDNTAEIEMARWSDQTGNEVLESRKESNLYHFIVRKS